jgi:putative transposase
VTPAPDEIEVRSRAYYCAPASVRSAAESRLAVVAEVGRLIFGGTAATTAAKQVAQQNGIDWTTIHRWWKSVRNIPRHAWLFWLAPAYGLTSPEAEIHPDAWKWLKADWLRLEAPPVSDCYRRLEPVAKAKGWPLPSLRTVQRRLNALPLEVRVLAREGEEKLKRLYPAQERDRSMFRALQACNADGHRFDVFVKWPDGRIARPVMVALQCLYSGKIVGYRVDETEHAGAVRLAIGDVLERYGVPELLWLDNGRGFASKWISGGTPTRFRFKVQPEDPVGLLPALGIEAKWTLPYSGQSKPIERAFRDLCTTVAKHPAFAGAYTGNRPDAKPENYGSKCVPLEQFLGVLAGQIAEHNARKGRKAANCKGRSFDDTFAEDFATAPVRRITVEQRRLWMLAAQPVKVVEGCVHYAGNRYWCEDLPELTGQRVVLRFDPSRLHDSVEVYRADGSWHATAECVDAAGFADSTAAREHNRARKDWLRAQRQALAAERRMDLAQLVDQLPTVESAPMPDPKILRPAFGGRAKAPATPAPQQDGPSPLGQLIEAEFARWAKTI